MLQIAICDDDPGICQQLKALIEEHFTIKTQQVNIKTYTNVQDFIDVLKNEMTFDLIFLDIELGEYSGIEVGNVIRKVKKDYTTKIIFISSKDGYEYALFDLQPLNFLRKPLQTNQVVECLEVATAILHIEDDKFEYYKNRELYRVNYKEIMYFEGMGKKIKIITMQDENEFYGSLERVKEALPMAFISPHKSYIVNYNMIHTMSGECIRLVNGKEIAVSKAKRKEMREIQVRIARERRHVHI